MGDAGAGAIAAAPPGLAIKLLVDKKARRVLFAEARKDVVDFLFGLLTLPVGTVVRLLASGDSDAPGGVASIRASAEKMDPAYLQSGAVRDALLNTPLAVPASMGGFHFLTATRQPAAPSTVHGMATPPPTQLLAAMSLPPLNSLPQQPPPPATPSVNCPPCLPPKLGAAAARTSRKIGTKVTSSLVAVFKPTSRTTARRRPAPGSGAAGGADAGQGGTGRGFVKGSVTYTIMDDLTIMPMSYVSGMAMLSRLNEEEKGLVLEEKAVTICYEGLEILKASLQASKTVLSDVFLSKKRKRARTSSDGNDDAVGGEEKSDIPDFDT